MTLLRMISFWCGRMNSLPPEHEVRLRGLNLPNLSFVRRGYLPPLAKGRGGVGCSRRRATLCLCGSEFIRPHQLLILLLLCALCSCKFEQKTMQGGVTIEVAIFEGGYGVEWYKGVARQ